MPPRRHHHRPLTVIMIGAAERAEERLLLQTEYFAELGTFIAAAPSITLHLVGPEMSKVCTLANHASSPGVGVCVFF